MSALSALQDSSDLWIPLNSLAARRERARLAEMMAREEEERARVDRPGGRRESNLAEQGGAIRREGDSNGVDSRSRLHPNGRDSNPEPRRPQAMPSAGRSGASLGVSARRAALSSRALNPFFHPNLGSVALKQWKFFHFV